MKGVGDRIEREEMEMLFKSNGENGRCTKMEEYYYLLCFTKHNCFHTHVETLAIH